MPGDPPAERLGVAANTRKPGFSNLMSHCNSYLENSHSPGENPLQAYAMLLPSKRTDAASPAYPVQGMAGLMPSNTRGDAAPSHPCGLCALSESQPPLRSTHRRGAEHAFQRLARSSAAAFVRASHRAQLPIDTTLLFLYEQTHKRRAFFRGKNRRCGDARDDHPRPTTKTAVNLLVDGLTARSAQPDCRQREMKEHA